MIELGRSLSTTTILRGSTYRDGRIIYGYFKYRRLSVRKETSYLLNIYFPLVFVLKYYKTSFWKNINLYGIYIQRNIRANSFFLDKLNSYK